MAQNDLIKEIVFISDEQYEAPAFAWGISLAYLLVLGLAEILTTFVSPLVGMILYGLVLIALLVQSSIGAKKRMHHFLVILSILPLIHLLAMTVPLSNFDPIFWYLLIGVLLSVIIFIIARLTGLKGSTIGLRITRKESAPAAADRVDRFRDRVRWIFDPATRFLSPKFSAGEFTWSQV